MNLTMIKTHRVEQATIRLEKKRKTNNNTENKTYRNKMTNNNSNSGNNNNNNNNDATKQPQHDKVVEEHDANADIVTPWEVQGSEDGGIDYMKLVERFGSQLISQSLVDRFEALTGLYKISIFLQFSIFI